jgi:hypothetical protein
MKSLRLLLLGFCLLAQGLHAKFSLPLIDVVDPTTSTASTIAFWATTDVTVTASSTIKVTFPTGFIVPPALAPATCKCVFFKMTQTGTGASWATFSPSEVAAASGSVSGLTVTVTVPQDMVPGIFYLRFDKLAGVITPAAGGLATATMMDPDGNTIETKGMWIHNPAWADSSYGYLNGSVQNSSSVAVPGAMVFATTAAFPSSVSVMDLESGPRANTPTTEAIGTETIKGVTDSSGNFSLTVPSGYTYNVYAIYSEWDLPTRTIKTYKRSAAAAAPSSGTVVPASNNTVTLGSVVTVCDSSASSCPGY